MSLYKLKSLKWERVEKEKYHSDGVDMIYEVVRAEGNRPWVLTVLGDKKTSIEKRFTTIDEAFLYASNVEYEPVMKYLEKV